MNNITIIVLTLSIPTILVILSLIYTYKKKKNDPIIYEDLWSEFLLIKDSGQFERICLIGEKIVHNYAINRDHLQEIFKVAQDFESDYPKFERLKYEAYKRMPVDKRPKFN